MANPIRWMGDKFREGVDNIGRHPFQSLLQLAAGVAVPGGGLVAGQAFNAYNTNKMEGRSSDWINQNGGLPSDLGGNGQSAPVSSAPRNAGPLFANVMSGGMSGGSSVSPQALADFQSRASQRLADQTSAAGDQITRDTIAGNYTRPSGRTGSAGYSSPAQAGNDSRGGFAAQTGSARGTTDVGGVLANLAGLGANDGYGNRNYSGQDAFRQSLRAAESSGDKSQIEWARQMRQEAQEQRMSGNGSRGASGR